MDDSFSVGGIESVGNLDRQSEQNIRLHRLSGDALFQRYAVQKLHGDECLPVMLINLVNRADVRMIERRSGLGFALKTAQGLRVFGYLVRQKLESHEPAEFCVLGLIDDTHAAAAQLLDDAEVGNRSTGEWRRIGHRRESYAAEEGQVNLRGGFREAGPPGSE